jgi:hypothetical protein
VQPVSPTLAAAIDATPNEPLVRVLVDWDRNGFQSATDAQVEVGPGAPTNTVTGGTCPATGAISNVAGGVRHQAGLNVGGGTTGATAPQIQSTWPVVAGAFDLARWTLKVDGDPGVGNGYYWAVQGSLWPSPGGKTWYAGLQQHGNIADPSFVGKIAIFAVWGAQGAKASAVAGAWAGPHFENEGGYSVRVPFAWATGTTYTLRVEADTVRGPGWWACYVDGPGGSTHVGSIQAAAASGLLHGGTIAFTEYFTNPGNLANCDAIPGADVTIGTPVLRHARLDDLSADVKRLRVSRALTTDLPPEARPYTGLAAATAELDLARDDDAEGEHAAWWYSPWNTASPLYAKDRKGAPATVEVGFRTDAGPEYVKLLTGRVRALGVNAGSRVAKLEIVDYTEDLHKTVTLPMIVWDNLASSSPFKVPGLTGAFLADWVLRQCGRYASPPMRSGCILSATMHGSGWPEKGSIIEFYGLNGSLLAFPPATQASSPAAKWVAGVDTNGTSTQRIDYATDGPTGVVNGTRPFVEGWFYPRATDDGIWHLFANGDANTYISLWIDSNRRLQVNFRRGAADSGNHSTGTSGPIVPALNQYYYMAVWVDFRSGGAMDVWINLAGTWTGPIAFTTPSITSGNVLNEFRVGQGPAGSFATEYFDGVSEAVQVTSGEGTSGAPGTPPAHNASYVPNAVVMAGKNELLATPPTTDEALNILVELAKAELGMFGFTEQGIAYYRDRSFFTVAPQTVSQRTLRATADLKELAGDEATDAVKNRIVVTATPPEVQAVSDIWRASGVAKFNAGQARTFPLKFAHPVANLQTQVFSNGSASQSRYNASTAKNGQGSVVSNLTFSFSNIGAEKCEVTITNPNGFAVYLVGNTGVSGVTPGYPSFILRGQFVLFDQSTGLQQIAFDQASIDKYGEQTYPYPSNAFLQDFDSVGTLATDLKDTLKDGPPTLSDVVIVGDPRLQLGDRDTIEDAKGLGIAGQDFHLAEIGTDIGEDTGLVQSIGTRAV